MQVIDCFISTTCKETARKVFIAELDAQYAGYKFYTRSFTTGRWYPAN